MQNLKDEKFARKDHAKTLVITFREYSFGHLKSAKSSENGRLRREKFQLPKELEF